LSADWRFHATEAALLQVAVDILGVEVIVPSWLQSFLLTALRTAAYASGFSVLVYLELVCLEGLSWASCSFFSLPLMFLTLLEGTQFHCTSLLMIDKVCTTV